MRIARPEVPRSWKKLNGVDALQRVDTRNRSGRGAPGPYPIMCMRQVQLFQSSNVQKADDHFRFVVTRHTAGIFPFQDSHFRISTFIRM
jgi:hypothetical protein